MDRGVRIRFLFGAAIPLLVVACGGVTGGSAGPDGGGASTGGATGSGGSVSTGGTPGAGGAHPATGGAGAATGGAGPRLTDCTEPLPAGKPCPTPSARCGGPCENSWQAENVCTNGTWQTVDTVPCGPNAANPPQCRNAFGGGQLTPCCPDGGLVCTGKADGYPGFGCTPGQDSFCACTCQSGAPLCGC